MNIFEILLLSTYLLMTRSKLFKFAECCYFPMEIQGLYVTQELDTVGKNVSYTQVNITDTTISGLGICYHKFGDHVVFHKESEKSICLRCFGFKQVSRNVIKLTIKDQSTLDNCYTDENEVLASCIDVDNDKRAEMILYKSNDYTGKPILKEHCPLDNRFQVKYYNEEEGSNVECGTHSFINSCPDASQLNINLKGCSKFESIFKFDCLGHWKESNGQHYVALVNNMNRNHVEYRCASLDSTTNGTSLTVSKDSTCLSLLNQKSKKDKFTLVQKPPKPWPNYMKCNFPVSIYGEWEQLSIEGEELMFRDYSPFRKYKMRCVKQVQTDKYLVLSRSQCEEDHIMYRCISLKVKSLNVLEFQVGEQSKTATGEELCADEFFKQSRWLTQARKDSISAPCPLSGEYIGTIPDAEGLCSKLVSNCNEPDFMHYQIYACETPESIYEERYYRCLGQWVEKDKIFAYTKRVDIKAYECFVGTRVDTEEKTIFIEEGGENCDRHSDPLINGMEMVRKGACNESMKAENILSSQQGNVLNELRSLNVTQEENNSVRKKEVDIHSKAVLTKAPVTFTLLFFIALAMYFN